MASASGTLSAAAPIGAVFFPTAGAFSVELIGGAPDNPVLLERSLDASVTFEPVPINAGAVAPAVFTGSLSFDVTEARSGAAYRLRLQNGAQSNASVAWEIYQ